MYYLLGCLRNFDSNQIYQGIKIDVGNEGSFFIEKPTPEVLSNVMINPNYLLYIGGVLFHEIYSNFVGTATLNNKGLKEKDLYICSNNFMQYLETFSTALWFIKDNAVVPSFVTISSDVHSLTPNLLRRNNIISNAKGGNDVTTFSRNDLTDAKKWYKILGSNGKKIEINQFEVPKGHHNLSAYMTFDVPSFERAMYFLGAARRADFLPSKIANYISILECLFAVKGENTLKVSQRAAYLLADSNSERIKISKEVKDAYTVRSNYVHGSEFKNAAHEGLPEISKNTDELVRRVLKEMIVKYPELNYKNSNKKDKTKKDFKGINDWFDELVLTKN